jgi:septum formation protein
VRLACSSPTSAKGLPTRLILASRSPQRRAILEQLGVSFSVVVPEVEEIELGPPDEVALENAFRKASAVAARPPAQEAGVVVLGVDTVVWIGGRLYGKAAGEGEARATLRALSGARHAVISGLCVWREGRARTVAARTWVDFRAVDDELLDWYLASGEWRERAGAYAIQGRGAALVAGIEGDYWNVVGLPVATLLELVPELLAGSRPTLGRGRPAA